MKHYQEDRGRLAHTRGGRDARGPEFLSSSPPAFGRAALHETVPEDRGRLARTRGGRDARGPKVSC